MTIQKLTQATALNPGQQAWAFPDLKNSLWAQKLDWYQNFLWAKAEKHKSKKLAPELLKIVEEEKVPLENFTRNKQNILIIASEQYFPNQLNVQLAFSPEACEQWVNDLKGIWEQLLQPSLRIFLPKSISPSYFAENWGDPDSHRKLSLVLELSSL